jgi:L-threonylcarbamoyladenylate synthase
VTKIYSINAADPQPDLLERARETLQNGGLVIIPTETVYGVACDPSVPGAFKKLISAKGRDGDKPVARLAAGKAQVKAAAASWNAGLEAVAARYWPGPLTIVLETAEGWTGYRVPDHAVASCLAERCGRTLALTSANLSGEPDSRTAQEAMASVQADLVLDGGPSAKEAVASTVVKVDGSSIECLREGVVSFTDIELIFKHQGTEASKKDS